MHNIILYEKSKIKREKICEKKKNIDSDLQIYKKDINNVIIEFAKI